MEHDYYLVLGLDRGADEVQIRAAYRRMARRCHPDHNVDPQAESQMTFVNEAYAVLIDPQQRAGYDRRLKRTTDPPPRPVLVPRAVDFGTGRLRERAGPVTVRVLNYGGPPGDLTIDPQGGEFWQLIGWRGPEESQEVIRLEFEATVSEGMVQGLQRDQVTIRLGDSEAELSILISADVSSVAKASRTRPAATRRILIAICAAAVAGTISSGVTGGSDENPPAPSLDQGTAQSKDKRLSHDLSSLNRAAQLNPRDATTHRKRGSVLLELGVAEDAVRAYDRAIDLNPDDASTHNDRGVALWRLGRLDEALAAFNRAVTLVPTHQLARENRDALLLPAAHPPMKPTAR